MYLHVTRPSAIAFFIATILVACGNGSTGATSPGSASADGTVAGSTLTARSQRVSIESENVAAACPPGDGGFPMCFLGLVGIQIASRAEDTCAAFQSAVASGDRIAFANEQVLDLSLESVQGNVASGTYEVTTSGDPKNVASAVFATYTATCAQSQRVSAISGTVTLTRVTSAGMTGTYDLNFGTQGALSGAFDVDVCAFPLGGGLPSRILCN